MTETNIVVSDPRSRNTGMTAISTTWNRGGKPPSVTPDDIQIRVRGILLPFLVAQ